ncbi:MAG: hypothetical protein GTO18_04965 [Anaerolineales bacterium]|nr:hypothetical protein [Anaerolineales bacterium]
MSGKAGLVMQRKVYLVAIFLGSTLLSACNAPIGSLFSSVPADSDSLFARGVPTWTMTPTPFLPLNADVSEFTGVLINPDFTPAPTPTLAEPWGDFPGPARESAIAIHPPVPEIEFPEGVVNIILLGSDEAPNRYGHRTDIIMILTLDPDAKKVTLLSIPRDLYVYVPGWRVDRINVASVFGGNEMVYQTILYNFGIKIDNWVRINFIGFQNAVDLLGGIDVQVTGYLYDQCAGTWYEYGPGTYHMNGFTALCYVRMRKASSDFDRIRRQQEVLEAIFLKVLSLDGLARVPQLYSEFSGLYESDVGVTDMIPLVPLASDLASGSATYSGSSIDHTMVTNWRVPTTGAAVLIPDRDKIQELLQTLYNYE